MQILANTTESGWKVLTIRFFTNFFRIIIGTVQFFSEKSIIFQDFFKFTQRFSLGFCDETGNALVVCISCDRKSKKALLSPNGHPFGFYWQSEWESFIKDSLTLSSTFALFDRLMSSCLITGLYSYDFHSFSLTWWMTLLFRVNSWVQDLVSRSEHTKLEMKLFEVIVLFDDIRIFLFKIYRIASYTEVPKVFFFTIDTLPLYFAWKELDVNSFKVNDGLEVFFQFTQKWGFLPAQNHIETTATWSKHYHKVLNSYCLRKLCDNNITNKKCGKTQEY